MINSIIMNFKIFFLGFLIASTTSASVEAQTKIGYTNVELLMNYMPETKQAEQSLNAYNKKLGDELQLKQNYRMTKFEEYQNLTESNRLTPEGKKKLELEINTLDQEIENALIEAEQKISQKRQELLNPVVIRIQQKINEIAREGGFTYILNQTSGNNILYGIESMDITSKLATKLGVSLN